MHAVICEIANSFLKEVDAAFVKSEGKREYNNLYDTLNDYLNASGIKQKHPIHHSRILHTLASIRLLQGNLECIDLYNDILKMDCDDELVCYEILRAYYYTSLLRSGDAESLAVLNEAVSRFGGSELNNDQLMAHIRLDRARINARRENKAEAITDLQAILGMPIIDNKDMKGIYVMTRQLLDSLTKRQ